MCVKKKHKIPKIVIIGANPNATGGIATWTKEMLDFENERFVFKYIDASYGKKGIPKSKFVKYLKDIIRNTRVFISVIFQSIFSRPVLFHSATTSSPKALKREIWLAKISRFFKIKYLVHFRCTIDDFLGGTKGEKSLRKLTKYASAFFVLNRNSLNTMETIGGKKENRQYYLVPNFINDEYVLDTKQINDEVKQAVFIGRVEAKKGYFETIELARAFPSIKFLIVGPNEGRFSKPSNLSNVVFTGAKNRNEVFRILDESDLFIFLTHYSEGFSNALLEAMSRGLPCLCSETDSIEEMIEGKGGIMVDYEDQKAIARGFTTLINDQELRKQMSLFNLTKVKQNYIKSVVLDDIFKLYESIINM